MPHRYPAETRRQVIELARPARSVSTRGRSGRGARHLFLNPNGSRTSPPSEPAVKAATADHHEIRLPLRGGQCSEGASLLPAWFGKLLFGTSS